MHVCTADNAANTEDHKRRCLACRKARRASKKKKMANRAPHVYLIKNQCIPIN